SGHRVGLVAPLPVRPEDLELVQVSGAQVGHEQFPHTAGAEAAHGVTDAVPVVEVADEANPTGVGCPHSEPGAGYLTDPGLLTHGVRTEGAPQFLVATLTDQVQVEVAQRGGEVVGVGDDVFVRPFLVAGGDAVVDGGTQGLLRHLSGEDPPVQVCQGHPGPVGEHGVYFPSTGP